MNKEAIIEKTSWFIVGGMVVTIFFLIKLNLTFFQSLIAQAEKQSADKTIMEIRKKIEADGALNLQLLTETEPFWAVKYDVPRETTQ